MEWMMRMRVLPIQRQRLGKRMRAAVVETTMDPSFANLRQVTIDTPEADRVFDVDGDEVPPRENLLGKRYLRKILMPLGLARIN
jgi:DNA gyrase/topoisomerase IV subunit B